MKEKLPLFFAAIFYHLGRSLARRWNVGRPFSWTACSVGSVGLPWPSRDFVLPACDALANRTQHRKAVILWCMFIKFYTHEWSNKWVLRWSPHTPKRVQKWAMARGTLKESGVAFFPVHSVRPLEGKRCSRLCMAFGPPHKYCCFSILAS